MNCELVIAVADNPEGAAGTVIDPAVELTPPATPVTPIVYAVVATRPVNVAVFAATSYEAIVAPVNVYDVDPTPPCQLNWKPVDDIDPATIATDVTGVGGSCTESELEGRVSTPEMIALRVILNACPPAPVIVVPAAAMVAGCGDISTPPSYTL